VRSHLRLAMVLPVALFFATALLESGCAPAERPSRPPSVRRPAPSHVVRFSGEVIESSPDATRRRPYAVAGWIDVERTRFRIRRSWDRPRLTEDTAIADGVRQYYTVDKRGHGIAEDAEDDTTGPAWPFGLVRSYAEELGADPDLPRELVGDAPTVAIDVGSGRPLDERATVNVRLTDGLPVRITWHGSSGDGTLTVEATSVASAAVPPDAFVLEFPPRIEPALTRTLTPSQAAEFSNYRVYWLGHSYGGMERTNLLYRASRLQGSPSIRPRAGGMPLWGYSYYGRENVVVAYWREDPERWVDTTSTPKGGVSFSARSPDVLVRSMDASSAGTEIGSEPPRVMRARWRAVVSGADTVVIEDVKQSSYLNARAVIARRIGDTVVVVEAADLARARAAMDAVVPVR